MLRKSLNYAGYVLPVAVIIIAAFAVYFNALFNDFVYDDIFQVTENQWITDIKYIPAIFTESVWGFQTWASSSNYYRPMMHLMYMISYHIFGLKPWGFHLVNILFHVANSVLVFLVASRLLADRPASLQACKRASWKAEEPESRETGKLRMSVPFIAALLFAAHPIHTEAVTWVAGLPEVSFTLFSLLSLHLYMRSKALFDRDYFFSVAFFFAAALCKETALTLLIILAACDFALHRDERALTAFIRRYVPFGIATVIYFAMRIYALGGLAPEKKHAYLNAYQVVINIFPLFSQYLRKLVLPTDLNAFYVFHPISSLIGIKGLVSLAVTGAFIGFAIAAFKKNRTALFALVLIAAPLLPALYIPGLGENVFADRYLYLPSAGFVILAGMLLKWAKARFSKWVPVLAAVFLIMAGLYCAGTVGRNAVWKDDLALYSDTARKSPDGFIPNNNLGYALMRAGRPDEAIQQLRTALRLKPDMLDILTGRAVSYIQKGLPDKAMLELNNVLLLDQRRADTHYYLGLSYALKGWLDQAVEEYMVALRLKPDYPRIHKNLAEVYALQGRLNEAVAELEAALKADPSDAQSSNNLGILYLQGGHLAKAVALFQSAVKLKPGDPTFRKNLDDALHLLQSSRKG